MKSTAIKHKRSGNVYTAEIYRSFVYIVELTYEITKQQFNDHFEIVK